MEAIIAKVKKNATAEIWISLTTFPGRQVVDIREFFYDREHHQWRPTKKGVMVDAHRLPQLIDSVQSLEEVTELGTVATLPNDLVVGYREYQGRRFAEIRTWYSPGDGKPLSPGKKGVAFNLELAGLIAEALRNAEDLLPTPLV